MSKKQRAPNIYEVTAARFLQQQGLIIIEQNFFWPGGEIDIIALEQKELVFLEVKFRESNEFGCPLEQIRQSQIKKIHHSALLYLEEHPEYANHPYRFDAIGIMPNPPQGHRPSTSYYYFQDEIQYQFENYIFEWIKNCF